MFCRTSRRSLDGAIDEIAAMDAKIAAEEAAIPQWAREYAIGGPSLDEINASEGIIPGGGMEEGEYKLHVIADAGGCPNTHDPCYPKGGKRRISKRRGIGLP